jgi:glycerol uptake operon antiterminator
MPERDRIMDGKRRMGVYNSDKNAEQPVKAADSTLLSGCSIIAAVNGIDTFEAALAAPTRAIYLLAGNPLNLPRMLERARDHDKICLVNIDFLDGLNRDRHAVEFLAVHKVAGIVSTRFEALKAAHGFGLVTVQRTFAIDSAAVAAALKSMGQFLPDAMEVLPAMAAPKVAIRLRAAYPRLTIIGGGLIENVREIEELLAVGINSVSVSDPRLWLI